MTEWALLCLLFTYRAYLVPAGCRCAVRLGESKQASHRFQSSGESVVATASVKC